MNYNKKLETGEKIELLIDRKGKPGRYLSKIDSIVGRDTFIITRPVGEEEYTYLSVGEVIKIVYFREDGAYFFTARVIERIKSEDVISAKVTSISEFYKMQRRNYYRLRIMVPVDIIFEDDMNILHKHFDTIDISGGGIRINCNYRFKINMDVEVTLHIESIQAFKIKGRVIRVTKSDKDIGMYEAGIEFVDVDSDIRQGIIQYIFERQRSILKKSH